MARKVHGSRALLNLPGHHSTATIVAEIEDTGGWTAGKSRNGEDLTGYNAKPEWTFTLSDCDKRVYLELDFGSENNLENNLYKIDTMLDALTKLREGVVIENERYMKRRKSIPSRALYGQ
jgi:hypothetical protein